MLALESNADWYTHKATIIQGALVIIACTLLFLGSTCEPVLKGLGFIDVEAGDGTALHATRASTRVLVDDCEEQDVQQLKRKMMTGWNDVFSHVSAGQLCTMCSSADAQQRSWA